MQPILSICIPTYNRLHYLRELVAMLLPQLDAISEGEVELVISNNVSTDGTAEFCDSINRRYFRFWTNDVNIGGDRNFIKCIAEARGEYVWLVGDDDIVPSGAVLKVLELLKQNQPDLLLEYKGETSVYNDYGEFLKDRCQSNFYAALFHTLISANIFRHEVFDFDFAIEKLYTQYAHMFGLMKRLDGKVVAVEGFVATRPVRAEFAKYPSFLCVKQAMYFWYLAGRFEFSQFKCYAIRAALNLPMELGSRIKNWLLRCQSRFTGKTL